MALGLALMLQSWLYLPDGLVNERVTSGSLLEAVADTEDEVVRTEPDDEGSFDTELAGVVLSASESWLDSSGSAVGEDRFWLLVSRSAAEECTVLSGATAARSGETSS